MKLEVYAAKLFNRFCDRQGTKGKWDYLSSTRKLVWIEEAYVLLKSSILELKGAFKPLKPNKAQASFEIGYNQGLSAERFATISFLEYLLKELDDQHDQLKEKYQK